MSVIEFAEEYSKAERAKRIVLAILFAGFIVITHEKWVFPFISWYAETVHCHTPLGYPGISVLWYSLFVGLPLLCALIIALFLVPLGINGLRDQQFPPKGSKVYKPTKILRGWRATLKSTVHLLFPLLFIIIAIWGYFQVDEMPQEASQAFDFSVCDK